MSSTAQHFRGLAAVDYPLQFTHLQHNHSNRPRDRYAYGTGDRVTSASCLKTEFRHDTENFRVKRLKIATSVANGQYKRLTTIAKHHELVVDRYDHDRIYRRDPSSQDAPVCILERRGGDWFPVAPLLQTEIQSLKPVLDSELIGFSPVKGEFLDPDNAIASGKRAIKHEGKRSQVYATDKHQSQQKRLKPMSRALIKGVQIR